MSLYKGTDLIAGAIPDMANQSLSNLNSTGHNVIDGAYNNTASTIASGVSLNGSTKLEYTLSDLPAENCLVWISATCATGNTSSNFVAVQITSDLQANNTDICRAVTRASNSAVGGGTVVMPVSSSKKIYLIRNTDWNGTCNLYLRGYRRMGTNS